MKSMRILNFTVVLTPDVTGGYVVTCPALPGLVSEGDTFEEARAMASDAIRGYLESLQKDGEPIPMDQSITEQLAVEVAWISPFISAINQSKSKNSSTVRPA